MATVVIAAVLLLLSVIAKAAPPPSSGGCTDELISFSPCLSYVSSPPNNLTQTASAKCCNAFSNAVQSLCFCYLVNEPTILGFPLNTTKLLSLSSGCPSTTTTTTSLNSLCSASPPLPPLNTLAINSPHITATRSARGGGGRGRSSERRRRRRGGRTAYSSHNNGPTLDNSLILSQILAIIVALTLLQNTVQ